MNGEKKRVTLALQGGGSHGAFTWGVLDRLAEEPRLDIVAISGTSAGALNAAVFAHGYMRGGAPGAKQALRDFWRSISDTGNAVFNPYRYVMEWPLLSSYVALWTDVFSHIWSPYDNPFYTNRMGQLLEDAVDFESLRKSGKPELFICATNVKTNERKIFRSSELNAEVLLASACLPLLFQAVEVKGNDYWDGGYMGNPVLSPLLKFSEDMLIVEVNPLHRNNLPRRATDILDRLNEITFNSALVQELDMINTMNKLIARGELIAPKYKPIRFHAINAEREMSEYGATSKSDTSWHFLTELHELGRQTAEAWLTDPTQFCQVGVASTCNVDERFIKPTKKHPSQPPQPVS